MMRTVKPRALVSASCLALVVAAAHAEVRLDTPFQDHAVLQRDRAIRITGLAEPNEALTLSFGGARVQGTAGKDGRFALALAPMAASLEPRELVVEAKSGRAVLKDILVGEVWFCSGQSNMEWTVDGANEADRAKAMAAKMPIRSYKAPHVTANKPAERVPGEWRLASPETVGGFTAVGWWFGVDLARAFDLEVPIGLVDISWGGTRIEPWIPLDEMAKSDFKQTADELAARIAAFDATAPGARKAAEAMEAERYAKERGSYWQRALADEPGAKAGWSSPEQSAGFPADWRKATLPAYFPALDAALERFDGFVWFTREFEVPAAMAGKACTLQLPAIDDCDRTLIDGVEVGSTVADWNTPRAYALPKGLSAGKHRITVAALDMSGQGGFAQGEMKLVAGAAGTVPLAGEWMWRQGGGVPRAPIPAKRDVARAPGTEPHEPAAIYNAMMAPWIAYPVRGAIWYQGESNAGEPDNYRKLLPLLIRSWRAKSGNPDMAWGVVQLAAFQPFVENEPAQGAWALLREAQFRGAREAGKAGMISATDIGEAGDIHPKKKREVGERLAAWARNTVYGESAAAWQGPELASATNEGGPRVRLQFEHAKGLRATGKEPGGFALAGKDGAFVWAKATIVDDRIVLEAPGVAEPVEVVYAWQNNPERANLVNGAGIPMIPFRARVAPAPR